MTSLHGLRFSPPPNSKFRLRLCIKPCAICIPDTGRCILVLLAHLHKRLLTTLLRCKATKYTLHCFQAKISLVWNGIWKKILVWNGIWNGRFLVWNGNGMEENCRYGIWKNRLPFHTMPCRKQVISKKKGLHPKNVMKSGVSPQKLRKYRWQTSIWASFCTPVAPSLLISSGTVLVWGGTIFVWGGRSTHMGGHGPGMSPVVPGLRTTPQKVWKLCAALALRVRFSLKIAR